MPITIVSTVMKTAHVVRIGGSSVAINPAGPLTGTFRARLRDAFVKTPNFYEINREMSKHTNGRVRFY